jgi:hypothetical protein
MLLYLIRETLKNKVYLKYAAYALTNGSVIRILCIKAKEIMADGCKICCEHFDVFPLEVERILLKTVPFKQFAEAQSFGGLVRIHIVVLSFRLLYKI